MSSSLPCFCLKKISEIVTSSMHVTSYIVTTTSFKGNLFNIFLIYLMEQKDLAKEAKLRAIESILQLTRSVQSEPVSPVRLRIRVGRTQTVWKKNQTISIQILLSTYFIPESWPQGMTPPGGRGPPRYHEPQCHPCKFSFHPHIASLFPHSRSSQARRSSRRAFSQA